MQMKSIAFSIPFHYSNTIIHSEHQTLFYGFVFMLCANGLFVCIIKITLFNEIFQQCMLYKFVLHLTRILFMYQHNINAEPRDSAFHLYNGDLRGQIVDVIN